MAKKSEKTQPKTQYLVLSVYGDEHGILDNADFAIMETGGLEGKLLTGMNLVREMQKKHPKLDLLEMVFVDYVKFISRETLESALGDNPGDTTLEDLAQGEPAIVEVEDMSEAAEENVGTVGMYVTEDRVHWEAVPKYCDFSIETGFVDRDYTNEVISRAGALSD